MIDIKIGGNTRKFNSVAEIEEIWITRQFNALNRQKLLPCIRILIEEGSVNLILSTQSCTPGGGSRIPNREESRIFEFWKEMKLDGTEFSLERLIAFFKRVRNLF